MDKDIIKEVLEALKPVQKNTDDFAVIRGAKFRPIKLDKRNFKEINTIKTDKKVVFIDGGNQEIISTPHLSLQFVRVYYTIYQDNRRIKSRKIEFYALITLKDNQSKQRMAEAKLFGTELFSKPLLFDLDELDVQSNLATIGNLLRRISEMKAAAVACEDITDSFIILDGTLFAPTKIEQEFVNGLFAAAGSNTIAAISKTSHLFTDNGLSINAAISQLSPEGCWHYFPVADIDDQRYKADLHIVRLNEKSSYQFIIELRKGDQPAELFSVLKDNSTDPVFLGYPYGLIEADQFARVSNQEKDQFRTMLMAKAGKDWKRLIGSEMAINAHSILDRIR
ncbi:hypothetical protein LDC_0047 [sediment metagenome]|uniref:NurA domain-containing protein n=1 Tax=sediment metagenome TaxID=749907 RepID=D9PEW9_9ZZZZ